MAVTKATLCDFADQTAESGCGESLSGISTTVYVGFKNDLVDPLPQLMTPGSTDTEFALEDYAKIEDTPGFKFKEGKHFYKWEFDTESGQLTSTSKGQQKGYEQTFTFMMKNMTPELSALMRNLNNRKDVFFLFPEEGHYVAIYDPDRNVNIADGGISYDSGKAAGDDSGTTVTVTLPTRLPKTYYFGTVTTTPAAGA